MYFVALKKSQKGRERERQRDRGDWNTNTWNRDSSKYWTNDQWSTVDFFKGWWHLVAFIDHYTHLYEIVRHQLSYLQLYNIQHAYDLLQITSLDVSMFLQGDMIVGCLWKENIHFYINIDFNNSLLNSNQNLLSSWTRSKLLCAVLKTGFSQSYSL